MSVSVVTTVISVLTLATATAGFGITAWIANVIATTLATGPSYYLNRRWTWGKTDPCAPHGPQPPGASGPGRISQIRGFRLESPA